MPEARASLVRRIQRLAGIDPLADFDESFFAPTGNDQGAQFCLKNLSPELLELDPADAHHFLCAELGAALGLELTLDESGLFAEVKTEPQKGSPLQLVLDLSDPLLVVAHYLGDARAITRLNAQLTAQPALPPARLGGQGLRDLRGLWTRLFEAHLNFEQSPKLFNYPQGLKAQLKGATASQLFGKLLGPENRWVELELLSGETDQGSGAWLSVNESAYLLGRGMKTGQFLEPVQAAAERLQRRYQSLEALYCAKLEPQGSGWFQLDDPWVSARLDQPIERIDQFLRLLGQETKSLELAGQSERLTPELWSLLLCDARGGQLKLEVSRQKLRAQLEGRASIALLDRLERFLAAQVCAGLSFLEAQDV
ncbi:MAG: hypothetical protein RRB13_07845 [bacterium]|nr:hypothetical protein [bacterium]